MADAIPQPASEPDGEMTTAVCRSVALGWQMARLFAAPLRAGEEPAVDEDLPGLNRLPGPIVVELGVEQIDTGLKYLASYLGAGTALPDTTSLRKVLNDSQSDPEAIRRAILKLHVDLLTRLTASDFRCGKSYGLGRALADTCSSSQTAAELIHHLDLYRVLQMRGWLSDLKTLLPDHTAEVVSSSLETWIDWASENPPGSMDEHHLSETSRALHAQGQRWRALLSAEKSAKDALELADYVSIASAALGRTGQLGGQLISRLRVPFALGLLGLGIALVFAFNGAARVIAGLGTIAVTLGITWHGVSSAMAQLSLRLEEPIWGGECDRVIADRLTSTPAFAPPPVLLSPTSSDPTWVDDTVVLSAPPAAS